MKKFFAALLLALSVSGFSQEKISVFIDISGSMDGSLTKIQEYFDKDFISKIKMPAEMKIYKFYWRGDIEPPIFDGVLENDDATKRARDAVNALSTQKKWTDCTSAFKFVDENCADSQFFIFTDDLNETPDASDDYEITAENVGKRLAKTFEIEDKNGFKIIRSPAPKKLAPPPPQVVEEIKEEVTQVPVKQVKEKRHFNFGKILIGIVVAIVLALLVLLVLFVVVSLLLFFFDLIHGGDDKAQVTLLSLGIAGDIHDLFR